MGLASGSNFGPYRIIEPLGRGGMASVYKAYEAALDRYVALKVLPGEFLHDETFAERFRREAKVIARLEHPNVVPIHAFGIENGIPWMAMRLISGGTLAGLLRQGPLAPGRAVLILRGVAEALDYAHGKGVVHRDIKPQNVLLDEAQRIYLADFGIAKMVEGSGALTQTGMISGTPQYMAPEQATGRTVDLRCDIYALGVVAYEMLTGRVPFSADTPVAVLMKHVTEPIPLPRQEEVPEPVVRALLKSLAKKPEDRWPSATAFVRAIEEAASQVPTVPLSAPPPTAVLPAPGTKPAVSPATGAESELTPLTLTPEPTLPPPPPTSPARDRSLPPPPRMPVPPRVAGAPIPVAKAPGAGIGLGLAVAGGLVLVVLAAALFLVWMRNRPTGTDMAAASPQPPVSTLRPPLSRPTPKEAPASVVPATTIQASAAPAIVPRRSAPPSLTPSASAGAPLVRPAPPAAQTSKPPAASESAPAAVQREPLEKPTPTMAEAPPPPMARGTLRLDVDAMQDPYAASPGVLFLQIAVDGRPLRDLSLVFTGRDAFTRSRRRETFDVEGVPVGRRRVTLRVSPDRDMARDRVEGSADLTIEQGTNRAYVQVRYLTRGDREVRFR